MPFFLHSSSFPFGSISRRELLTKTILIEGALALLAFSLGYWPGPEVETRLTWSWNSFAYGALAAAPPLLILLLIDHYPIGPLRKVKDISEEFLRPILRNCKWPDFFLLSALAGFCEELFFRGWMQPFFAQWMPNWGSNLLVGFFFACCHAITPAYFLIAWLISLYFGGLLLWSDNLLVPMVTHGVYDLIALFAVMYSRNKSPSTGAAPESCKSEISAGPLLEGDDPAERQPLAPPSESPLQ